MFMMYEAFQLTLNQVSGSIGQDAMSMELLCIIDVSHRIDKNISKIASIAFTPPPPPQMIKGTSPY